MESEDKVYSYSTKDLGTYSSASSMSNEDDVKRFFTASGSSGGDSYSRYGFT